MVRDPVRRRTCGVAGRAQTKRRPGPRGSGRRGGRRGAWRGQSRRSSLVAARAWRRTAREGVQGHMRQRHMEAGDMERSMAREGAPVKARRSRRAGQAASMARLRYGGIDTAASALRAVSGHRGPAGTAERRTAAFGGAARGWGMGRWGTATARLTDAAPSKPPYRSRSTDAAPSVSQNLASTLRSNRVRRSGQIPRDRSIRNSPSRNDAPTP